MKTYDVIVIGSGGGMKIAAPAARRGMSVAFIEERDLGGTCLNRGCIPSKMLIYPADLLALIDRTRTLEMESMERPAVDFERLVTRIQRSITQVSDHISETLTSLDGLDLYREHATFTDNHTLRVGEEELRGEKIFIATGSRPSLPIAPCLTDLPFMTSEDTLRNTSLPESMIIIGAGYIACELGHAYNAFGTETHFVVRSEMLRPEDNDIKRIFKTEFAKRHHLHERYVPVHASHEEGLFTVTLRHMESGEEKRITAEALLVATGITPETDRLGLEHTEVRRDEKGFICVDNHLRTDADGVYALGDCVGNYLFRHSVNVEGEYLVRAALDGQAGPLAYPPMPHAVFTLPEVACVGETEEKLQARNATYVRGIATFADCNMGLARRLDHGIVKLLIDRHTRKILGVHIIGEEASSLLHTPLAFMTMGATLDDMLSMVYIHPALPEILREAAREAAAALPTT